ncbi:acyl carrier protein [Chromobacterium piscinae]|uniref:acyl carrier protein n=1 Tax=Chromobacterium piscinae TaxID=686831 RepID=UPI003D32F3B0
MFSLPCDAIGANSSFFDLGGTSLDILKLKHMLERRFDCAPTPSYGDSRLGWRPAAKPAAPPTTPSSRCKAAEPRRRCSASTPASARCLSSSA